MRHVNKSIVDIGSRQKIILVLKNGLALKTLFEKFEIAKCNLL